MFVCGECGQRYERAGYCAVDGQPLTESDDPLLGTDLGRYRLASLIGEGGMGRVYLAVQPVIGSRVAVKVLSDQCAENQELVERFFAEARSVNLIKHENIVNVLDLAKLDDGRPYIVMEYVAGSTLTGLIAGGPLPIGGVARVMQEVLSALAAAHAIGIVHRDLKPDNVLVTVEGHAKVLDFGIAKLAPGLGKELSPRTRTGALLGTPAYMAPEQISGNGRIDPRTDVYAAGVVLFEAVTGRLPFRGEALFDLMREHLEEAPPSPRGVRPELPESLERVILTAMSKQPEERFQSCLAMAIALGHAAAELPQDQQRSLSSRSTSGVRPPKARTTRPLGPQFAQNAPTVAMRREATTVPSGPPVMLPPPARRRWLALVAIAGVAIAGGIAALIIAAGQQEPTRVAVAAPAPAPAPTPPTPTPTPTPPAAPPPQVVTEQPKITPKKAAPTPAPVAPTAVSTVHRGANVVVGHNVYDDGHLAPGSTKGTAFTLPVDYNPKQFIATAYVGKALALAQRVYADAQLVKLDVYWVYPDGHADLTKGDHETTFRFRSPSHSKRPAGTPANVEVELACYVEVTVGATQIDVRVHPDDDCRAPLRLAPRCTVGDIWNDAKAAGAKLDTVAELEFDGKWSFDAEHDGKGFESDFPDQCP